MHLIEGCSKFIMCLPHFPCSLLSHLDQMGHGITTCVSMCDVSRTFEDLPDPLASSSKMVHRPAVQVNRFSWFNNAKTDKILMKKGGSSEIQGNILILHPFFPHNRHLSSLRSVCKRWYGRWPEVTGLKVRNNKHL